MMAELIRFSCFMVLDLEDYCTVFIQILLSSFPCFIQISTRCCETRNPPSADDAPNVSESNTSVYSTAESYAQLSLSMGRRAIMRLVSTTDASMLSASFSAIGDTQCRNQWSFWRVFPTKCLVWL